VQVTLMSYIGDGGGRPVLDSYIETLIGLRDEGFRRLWSSQLPSEPDLLTLLAVALREVEVIEVGSAVLPIQVQHPSQLAQRALVVNQIAGGRLTLGLGVHHIGLTEELWGISFDKPVRLMREYLDGLQPLLAGAPAAVVGDMLTTRVTLQIPGAPAPEVYLAALGPRMLELAGRIADGVILNLMTPAQAGAAVSVVRASAKAAGRDPESVEIACVVHCCLGSDGLAAAAARAAVLRYVMHPAAPRLFGELDGGPSLRGVQELVLAGDRAAAADAVPQQVADGFVVHGGADECIARASEYTAAGVDLPVLFPMPADGDWGYEKTIAAMAGKLT